MGRVSPKALDTIRRQAEELAGARGLSIAGLDYVQEDMGWVLRVTVDCPGGVGVDDCESVARPLSKRLDELNLIADSYFLEVTSPGASDVAGVPNLAQVEEAL